MNKKNLLNLLDQVSKEEKIYTNPHERVVLIDALNLFFRNFAMLKMVNPDGTHIGGLGGFLRSLNSLVKTLQPTSVYVVFDGVGSSINRKNLLAEYKSGRNQTRITNWETFDSLEEENDAKINQITRLIHYLKCLPVKTVSLDKVEADDIIAYISNILSIKHNSDVIIVSNDRDYIQLINKNITIYRPTEKELYTPQIIKSSFGIPPENFILYKTLMGDQSDKIEGIKGLGPKGILKKFPELAEQVLTFDQLMEIAESKIKEHVIYARVIHEETKLKNNFKLMNLHNPLIDDDGKQYLEEFINYPSPKLDIKTFVSFYNEDNLGKLIKNPEVSLNDVYKIINSFN
jgi:DNA polymerase-1